MEVALNSMVTSTQMRSTNSAMTTALPSANFRADSSGIVDFFNSNSRGFENGNVLTSSNGLALLASLTLKKALNVGNVYSQTQQKNPNIVSMLPTSNVYSFNNITAAAVAATSSRTTSTTTAKITSSSNNSSSLPTSSPSSQSKNKNKDVNVTSVATITKSSSSTAMTASMTTNSKHGIATTSAISAKTTSTTTTAISNNSNSRHNFQIPSDILDDLASRFIINVPDMELSNLIRICFQIELAHWFYLDFFCASDEEKKLKPCGIKQFAMQLFQHIPFLHEHLSSVDKILEDWKNYKLSVPTYGAILISEDLNYCLLVQSYFSKSSWGFPKGKVNENEDPEHCAAREVYEETGYDITELIVPNDYIEAVINYQFTRLYIVRNVSLQTQFSPRTRNEIKCCDWFPIDSLPAKKNDAISKTKLGINANSFFMIMPFVKRLKKWVNDIRAGIESRRKFPGGGSICNGGGENTSPTVNLVSVSNTSTTATTALVSGNFNNINNNNNNLNINNSNNQKHLNANSNCKKNKQQKQNIDEKNALRSDIAVGGGGEGGLRCNSNGNGNAANTLANSSSLASAAATGAVAASVTVTSSNRSKRQRHKSMGDLDGIKLNNLSHNNISNQSNCKFNGASANSNVGATATTTATTTSTTTTANAVANNNNNCNQNSNLIVGNNGVNSIGSNQKRNLIKIVAGSNTNNNNTNNNNNNNSSNNNNNNLNGISNNHVSTTKRQLFHNQNQNGGEKLQIISSFDLIRKEKQQQIKAAAQAERTSKAQKQQQQINGRVRAKSQGDKMCMQAQQQQQPQQLQQQTNNNINNLNNMNNSNNNKNNSKQRGQKQLQQQQTMIINNTTNMTNMSANNNVNINNQMHISTANNTVNGYVTPPIAPTPVPVTPTTLATSATLAAPAVASTTASSHLSGVELIALAASAAAARTSPTTKRQNSEVVLHKSYSSAPNTVQKPRPSSVSLHFATTPSLNSEGDITAMQQLQRMASVTNLRILKRATSHQPQLQHQLEQHQQLKFTPNFNSWTNFSFTKNFIANVFC